jgi:hypothetical protein
MVFVDTIRLGNNDIERAPVKTEFVQILSRPSASKVNTTWRAPNVLKDLKRESKECLTFRVSENEERGKGVLHACIDSATMSISSGIGNERTT